MNNDCNVFSECVRLIKSEITIDTLGSETLEFLRRANYIDRDNQYISKSSRQDDNRIALLMLASKIYDVVDHQPTYAPNDYLFRGTVDLDHLGLDQVQGGRSGVGGRGENFRTAFESCIGEAAEYISLHQNLSGRSIPNSAASNVDECTRSWIAAGLGLDSDTNLFEFALIEASPVLDGSSIHVPPEFVVRSGSQNSKVKRVAESTGLAAAPTRSEAINHGLREVVERDSYALWWYGHRHAKAVSPEIIAQSSIAGAIGIRVTTRKMWFLDITSDLQIPVLAAISCENDGARVVVGLGCDLDPTVALIRSYLELAQMEEAMCLALDSGSDEKSEHEIGAKDRLWQSRQSHLNAYVQTQFRTVIGETELFEKTNSDANFKSFANRLSEQNYTPYFVDLTIEEIGIPVVRVFVPGLQSPKPDWMSDRLGRQLQKSGISSSVALTSVAPV